MFKRIAMLSALLLAGLVLPGRAMDLDPRRLMALSYQDSLSAFDDLEGKALALVQAALEDEGFAQKKPREGKSGEKLTFFIKKHETGEMGLMFSSVDGKISQKHLFSINDPAYFTFDGANFGVHQFADRENLVISARDLFGSGYSLEDFTAIALSGGLIVVKAMDGDTIAFARTPFPKGSLADRLGGNASPNMQFGFCASRDPAAPGALVFTAFPGCHIPWNDYQRAVGTALARE